ncbi:SRPBCC family protein [Aquipuribacter sp. SD81]|uniref:SRPBCC family protein n=1 Tax=Aquipuribacter sp. SD81 TaxID=3127703 RepID=UPI003015CF1D
MSGEQSLHLAHVVARSPEAVYRFAVQPANLPRWAAGLASGVREGRDGWWLCASPLGDVRVRFAPENRFGVLDHTVVLPDGTSVLNPLRVLPHPAGSEVVFTYRRSPGQDDAAAAADEAAVRADLARLADLLVPGTG